MNYTRTKTKHEITKKLVKGCWLVNIISNGEYSLAETLGRPLNYTLMRMQKHKYVRPSIIHIVQGDIHDGENYLEIVGSAKQKKKKLKECFEEYPQILKIIDKMDFSKWGYTEETINQFKEIVSIYNSSK